MCMKQLNKATPVCYVHENPHRSPRFSPDIESRADHGVMATFLDRRRPDSWLTCFKEPP